MRIKEIQNKLRQLKEKNITQGDIAKAIGTTRSNVSQLFSKNSIMSDEKIKKIEKYFNVNLECDEMPPIDSLVKVPLYKDFTLNEIDRFIYVSDFFTSKLACPFALRVNSNSMQPYINKGDLAIFDKDFEGFEDGRIFLVRYKGNFFIKRILNNLNEIILKSDNNDYRDISIPDFRLEHIDVVAKFHSLVRDEGVPIYVA